MLTDTVLTLSIQNVTLIGNYAVQYGGGGVSFNEVQRAVIQGSEFRNNNAPQGGGGFYMYSEIFGKERKMNLFQLKRLNFGFQHLW